MHKPINPLLVAGAVASALAGLLHLVGIAFGVQGYRWLGAGQAMVDMAAAGHWYPTVVTWIIAAALSSWSLYALSAAGLTGRLPLRRPLLCAITATYLLRGVAFPLLLPLFPENSLSFWLWSSFVCLAIGVVHLIGLHQVWRRL